MIPKIIHYIWLGGKPLPKIAEKCIESWKKYLPDYEIREWNDEDLKNCTNQYVQEAYGAKKWAFITDYFRLYALYNYGGIYFDSDNEVFKSFDEFLRLDFFSGYEDFRGEVYPFTAVVGAQKGNKIVKDLLDEYTDLHFINENGEMNLCTNTCRVTDYFKRAYNFLPPYDGTLKKHLEENSIIFPAETFCKYNEGVSYAVHHFNGSWVEKKKQKKLTFWQKVFSVKNYDEKRKIIRVLGFKIIISKIK